MPFNLQSLGITPADVLPHLQMGLAALSPDERFLVQSALRGKRFYDLFLGKRSPRVGGRPVRQSIFLLVCFVGASFCRRYPILNRILPLFSSPLHRRIFCMAWLFPRLSNQAISSSVGCSVSLVEEVLSPSNLEVLGESVLEGKDVAIYRLWLLLRSSLRGRSFSGGCLPSVGGS